METTGIPKHNPRPLYRELAQAVQAQKNMNADHPWFEKWTERIKDLMDRLPHGSGIDGAVTLDMNASHADKLVIHFSYHHMNGNGFYCGWTEHTLTVKPSFNGLNLRISGSNRNSVKDDLYEVFDHAMHEDVTYWLHVADFPQWKIEHKWEDTNGEPSQCYQAFYVDGVRFWNDFHAAIDYAADQMQNAFVHKGR